MENIALAASGKSLYGMNWMEIKSVPNGGFMGAEECGQKKGLL